MTTQTDLQSKLRGSLVAIITPMLADGSIDYPGMRELIEWHIASGTDGIVVSGTTGEAPTLSFNEIEELVSFSVEVVNKRVPVIAGSGTNATRSSIELSQRLEKAGADALLVVVPYYNKPTQQGMQAHFLAVTEAVNLPIILYNVPGRTSSDLLPETVIELAKHPRIIAIKEAKETDGRIQEIITKCKNKLILLSGDDLTCREFILLGGDGVISVTANILPRQMHLMTHAALAGDLEKSLELDEKMAALHTNIFKEPNPCPTKWALAQMGKIGSETSRLPLLPLSTSGHELIRDSLKVAGILL
ncbi:MAG: 4-hydroxy-tetrahydrodipicolinate synthase [Gammaproteobacteria bacterium]|nr:4-hydroxy-tetrahydrodipicolinate synthase [Gammaproteobacteria bacterium]